MTNNSINKKVYDGRTIDLTLGWLTKKYGQDWETWRQLAEMWIKKQDSALDIKLSSLSIFFDTYLASVAPCAADIVIFFTGKNGWQPSINEIKHIILDKTNRKNNKSTIKILNHITTFLNWVLDEHFTELNDYGVAVHLYSNPFEKIVAKEKYTETVHSPLPYRYICDLRHILCPTPRGNFSDWLWAHNQTGQWTQGGDWFEVNESLIDSNDKDCVWRVKEVNRCGKLVKIYQIWSPVVAMVLFIKLHLPLRTYQVRMLDSGEADSLRYEKGKWVNNHHAFAFKHYRKGVFRQFKDNATGLESTGLYISTNKTADQNKEEFERGYEVPWQNEDVLYWLEKLRNWQEKYNPINKPTDCTTLEAKHTKSKKSHAYLSAMGYSCFLFRDASASKAADRTKPIQDAVISFMDTTSDLLHLSLLCEDAEIYPDLLDEVKKTSVIQQRTQHLCQIMMRKGYSPYLLMLDQDHQLIAANAMMRQMALQANPSDKLEGFKKVTSYLELGQFMQNSKLLDVGLKALEHQIDMPSKGIPIKSLTSNTK
ncbi:hypothetical protein AMQ28_09590 [Acinetobacter sp. TTH0-4]|uniref:VPA1269 family protein n=1 Tax=Acinetobacter sp. TTH0-4 TaxID=1646498 RepID=UPI0006AFA354|nr:VPA1269 family protein [Acinetobacter sp. TTH0-4]ALD02581.1 hypothetical protein AMQ28_09590 [Acinetobacter sp. TTH0-4]